MAHDPRMDIKKGSPDGYRALAGLTRGGHPDHVLSELVKVRASCINNCAYCINLHEAAARKAGISDERLAALRDWQASDLFDDRERAALALADLLTSSDALSHAEEPGADPTWAAAAVAFPGDELPQLVITITAINSWNRVMIASGLEPGAAK